MELRLERIRLPLAHFELAVDAAITARVTALFGPSGSGKTSLLDVIAGLRRSAGRVILDGRDLTGVPARERNIGYVPQENALFPHLSVARNIRYGVKEAVDEQRVLDALEIGHLMQRSVTKLSGGEQKRVALARALLASPKLLLLDEPLAGLDRPLRDRIAAFLIRIRDELRVPMLYVTHDEEEIRAIADDVLKM
ncbi:MAG TPA: ATP-binding cassette domain-containing protein [Thermoanaerobaculia bacterium]|nr:ATP-binding cassette domain-containing protein [Thermoanaerobaculia bacterium]